ncbi:VOC family protein [Caldicellulosiruptoraceae bacterium PP1]
MITNFLDTDVIVQIGIIVKDINKTAQKYAEFLNVDFPEIIITDEFEKTQAHYKGQPTEARAKLAFFRNFKNIEIELIEPDDNPSTWREFLDTHGEGVHHIAFFIKGMKEKVEIFNQKGMPLIQKGEYTGGRYAYLDSTEQLKVIIELLEND